MKCCSGGLLFTICWVFCHLGVSAGFQAEPLEKPKVSMRMELLSNRNRSSGPLPVRIKLEYNLPQILEGNLELSIYDTPDDPAPEDLMATIRHEGIVLSGQDYQFNTILPPLRTAASQNWAIVAWFITEQERIPLSSIRDRIDPPEPHDLLTTSPLERGTLVCSCNADSSPVNASANRRFLENALALDNYNPIYERLEKLEETAPEKATLERTGRIPIHMAGNWSAKDMPADPLSYCAFDLVILSDGGLSRLAAEQTEGLTKWVRAGGSLCVLPDQPLKPMHLEFLRTLLDGSTESTDLTLDADGRLLVVSDEAHPVLKNHYGLGRVVVLPAVESLEQILDEVRRGQIVAFLWKVRRDQPVWEGQKWRSFSLLEALQKQGISAAEDQNGVYLTDPDQINRLGHYSFGRQNRKLYIHPESLRRDWSIDDRLRPETEPLLSAAEQALLPSDVEMVPISVITMILAGYILTIGPIDYFLLGWLRLRKYTWILFPVVTGFFTLLTVLIANSYLASDDTGGKLVITDVVNDGIPARRTVLETLYYSSQAESTSEHRNELVVQGEDVFTQADWMQMYNQTLSPTSQAPLAFSGHFPQSYTVSQRVQQWDPISLRTLSLEPETRDIPAIDWSDPSLIETSDGRHRLAKELSALAMKEQVQYSAAVFHGTESSPVLGYVGSGTEISDRRMDMLMRWNSEASRGVDPVRQMMARIPTAKPADRGIFRLVSQVAPEGASSLEDLAFLDTSDPDQWALVIVRSDERDFFVFRKLYLIRNAASESANTQGQSL